MPPKKAKALTCYQCGEEAETAVSKSEKNPNKPYLKCTNCPSSNGVGKGLFLGWFGEYDGSPPKRKGSYKKPPPPKEDTEEEEESEEEKPAKKRKREEDPLPKLPFLDKIMRDKITQNAENSHEILDAINELQHSIIKLTEKLEKVLEEENKSVS